MNHASHVLAGAASAGARAVRLPGGPVFPAGGLRDQLRAISQMERRPERHPRVRVQDRAGQRAATLHGRRRHLRLLRGQAGRERSPTEVQSRRRGADRHGRPRPRRRPLAQGADHQV